MSPPNSPPSTKRLTRREVLQTFAATGAAALLPGRGDAAPPRRRPNILLIVADDLGRECLGAYGGTSYPTPRLDALATQGIRFSHCFCTPLCTPSRVQLLTGQYPFRTGWTTGIWSLPRSAQRLDPALSILPSLLKRAGYATCAVGKWQLARFDDHPDHVTRCGFDAHCLWTWSYGDKAKPSRYWAPSVWRDGARAPELARDDIFGPDVYADYLHEFIARPRDVPFFAYYALTLPHMPFVETPRNRGESAKGPARFPGMVAYMDELVGRTLDSLDELGLREDTLVLFTSDNGTPRSVTSDFEGRRVTGAKGSLSDAGTQVPLLAHWRGVTPKAEVRPDLVDLSDLMPTLAELAGEALPPGTAIDGRSFAPQLRGARGNPRDWVFLQLANRRAVRTKRWKLYSTSWLYDLDADPFELQPLLPGTEGEAAAAARRRLAPLLDTLRA